MPRSQSCGYGTNGNCLSTGYAVSTFVAIHNVYDQVPRTLGIYILHGCVLHHPESVFDKSKAARGAVNTLVWIAVSSFHPLCAWSLSASF